jgi:serine/threonine protein kinase
VRGTISLACLDFLHVICTIHNYEAVPKEFSALGHTRLSNLAGQGDSLLYGRHSDIKPENVLWMRQNVREKLGVLQICDFGLGRFHRLETRSRVDPRAVAGTSTYAPPELFLENPISRAYDIWSLGCVFLEFVTWLVSGPSGLDRFTKARCMACQDGIEDDMFFTVDRRSSKAVVREGVTKWMTELHDTALCSDFIYDFLNLISEQMLVVDPQKRIQARNLTDKLSEMVTKAREDSNYLVQPRSHAVRADQCC